jgi:hypothetical protein
MDKIDWTTAPHDADVFISGYFRKWVDGQEYILAGSEWSKPLNSWSIERHELEGSFVIERPDPWAEGEERMKVIPQNGNEGEHYDELPELDEFLGTEADAVEPIMSVEGYDCLRDVLVRAYDQASKGKGDERHAQGSAFEDQPMQKIIDLYGVGFALGQSAKKAQESMRLPKDRAIAELLGGINYLAGAIINMEKSE